MKDNEHEVIASARFRYIDGRVQLQVLKVGRHYELVSERKGERCVDTLRAKRNPKRLLSDSEIDQNRGFEEHSKRS